MAKRKKILSILLIPEGEKQTFNFKISYLSLRVLLVFSLVFFVALAVGAVSYWEIARTALDYKRLERQNQKLLEKSMVINDIVDKFTEMQDTDRRISELFTDKIEFNRPDPELSLNRISIDDSEYSNLLRESKYRGGGSGVKSDILSSFPSTPPVEGQVTRFFAQKDSSLEHIHNGIDIVAKEYSVIRAAGDGIVVFSNWTFEDGYQVVIDHMNGYLTFYKHNASVLVRKRQYVYQGEPISLLGNSGNSSAPHLHFEIWRDYNPIDPLNALSNR